MAEPRFRRILLKLSGEALAGTQGHGLDAGVMAAMAREIAATARAGVQVALVIGGGNFVRGAQVNATGMNRAAADAMGMLGTVMNCLAMQDALDQAGCPSVVMSAVRMEPVCSFFDRQRALELLRQGTVVLFGAGTGNPFFTTDSAAALRAIEMECDVIMKATKVDGVYSADPIKNPAALRYEQISYDEVLRQGLGVMDLAAIALCREHGMPILVFKMEEGNLSRAVTHAQVGTLVTA